jgi:2-oxoacid dehydrogenases acyltransferase (catalytic domain)
MPPQLVVAAAACTPDASGITYNENVNVALAVSMPDGGLITPVLTNADTTDIYQLSRNWAVRTVPAKAYCLMSNVGAPLECLYYCMLCSAAVAAWCVIPQCSSAVD